VHGLGTATVAEGGTSNVNYVLIVAQTGSEKAKGFGLIDLTGDRHHRVRMVLEPVGDLELAVRVGSGKHAQAISR
jgi:hypothetical protein